MHFWKKARSAKDRITNPWTEQDTYTDALASALARTVCRGGSSRRMLQYMTSLTVHDGEMASMIVVPAS